MKSVYISCHHPDPANELAAKIRAAGHRVVSTWHDEASPRPAKDDTGAWGEKAETNLDVIRDEATVLVLISGDDRYPGGKFFEAGFALGVGVDVITFGRVENGMLHHPDVSHVVDAGELMMLLAM